MTYRYDHYYDFSKVPNFTEMNEVFSALFDRSVKYYLSNSDGYLEKYLIGLINLGYVTTSNLELVKASFKSLDTIGLLNSRFRGGIYGITDSRRIEINPNLASSRTLDSSERTLLYISHEMGHRLHFDWTNKLNVNTILSDKKVSEYHQRLPQDLRNFIYYGYDLLDEALTQDRAEDIAYYFAGKNRPELTPRRSRLFDGEIFSTNFDYYGELQTPAIMFAKSLKNISKDDRYAMKQISKAAIDRRFSKKIENEFRSTDRIVDLYAILHAMGMIKEASYEVFGMSGNKALSKSKRALSLLKSLTSQTATTAKKYTK